MRVHELRRPPRLSGRRGSDGGVGNIIGTLFGVLSLSMIKNIVSSLGLDEAWWTNITVAAMICLFLVVQSLVLSRKNKNEN